jgi:hypothetical protein
MMYWSLVICASSAASCSAEGFDMMNVFDLDEILENVLGAGGYAMHAARLAKHRCSRFGVKRAVPREANPMISDRNSF